jgi:hypothetical protein
MNSSISWDITPCSPLKVNRRFGGTCRFHFQNRISQETSVKAGGKESHLSLCLPAAFTLVSCLAYSSTLKMEVTCFSETSVDFQRTTRRYMPGDTTLQMAGWWNGKDMEGNGRGAFAVLFLYFPGKLWKLRSWQLLSRPRLEPTTSRIQD